MFRLKLLKILFAPAEPGFFLFTLPSCGWERSKIRTPYSFCVIKVFSTIGLDANSQMRPANSFPLNIQLLING